MSDKALMLYDGKRYYITEPPEPKSAVVKEEEKLVMGHVDFDSLAEDMSRLDTRFRKALK